MKAALCLCWLNACLSYWQAHVCRKVLSYADGMYNKDKVAAAKAV